MYQGIQEKLRLSVGLLSLLGLVGVTHAGLIPQGTDILFSTNSYSIYLDNSIHFMSPDNLYSSAGKVYLTNNDVLKAFNPAKWFMSFGQGLDALTFFRDPASGEVKTYFSTGRTFFSRTFGKNFGEGDLLCRDGTVVATNQQLVSKFSPDTSLSFGLDAVDVVNPGANQQIFFSTRNGFHSTALGQDIGAGDLLSNSGQVIATNADLLKAFAPAKPDVNYGLDSVHVVSMTEGQAPVVLFSTNEDFYSNALKRWISQGDILANDGEIVMTNADLLKKFGRRWPGNPGLDVIAFYPTGNAVDVSRVLPSAPGKPVPEAPTPDPATLSLLALAAGMFAARRRR